MEKKFVTKEELKQEFDGFKAFALKKNILEFAVGMILGTAFTKVVTMVAEGLFMPIIDRVLSTTGESWRETTVTFWQIQFESGKIIGSCVDFLITAIVLYIIYIKIILKVIKGQNQNEVPTVDGESDSNS